MSRPENVTATLPPERSAGEGAALQRPARRSYRVVIAPLPTAKKSGSSRTGGAWLSSVTRIFGTGLGFGTRAHATS